MNKYIWLILVLVVIVGGSIGYKLVGGNKNGGCTPTGETKSFTITAEKNEWAFNPDVIEVNCGDRVAITAVNKDDYDHGIGIDQFGISQRMPANQTISFNFIAIKPGNFQYICSVPCGEGEVHGVKRGHFDMVGTIKVHSLIKTQ